MSLSKMARVAVAFAAASVSFLSIAGGAGAANESASIYLKMDPLDGGLYKEVYRPVNWQVGTVISTPDKQIQPLKKANLKVDAGSLSFNPDPDMPVCPDSKINPTTVSVPVETAIAACPDSIIGNGTATFALGQSTLLPRDGVMIVFNGGYQTSGPLKGRPRIMTYAYSYDVEVGVYTEATLSEDGRLDFDMPVLASDSSVTSLNLAIPGKPTTVEFKAKGITANLPAGQDPNYARAKCATGTWSFGAEFVLGDRPEGLPPGPETTIPKSGTEPCEGSTGNAKFAPLKIKGPGSVKAGRRSVYRVVVRNAGTATAKKATVKATGRGVRSRPRSLKIAPGATKTVKLSLKFTKKAATPVTFVATAPGAPARAGKKTVKAG